MPYFKMFRVMQRDAPIRTYYFDNRVVMFMASASFCLLSSIQNSKLMFHKFTEWLDSNPGPLVTLYLL